MFRVRADRACCPSEAEGESTRRYNQVSKDSLHALASGSDPRPSWYESLNDSHGTDRV